MVGTGGRTGRHPARVIRPTRWRLAGLEPVIGLSRPPLPVAVCVRAMELTRHG
ncbi:MAG: hypothetical protein JWR63_252 [Conexibacter sp.]|nr:hypothetical protein [Conexibacter sp.]